MIGMMSLVENGLPINYVAGVWISDNVLDKDWGETIILVKNGKVVDRKERKKGPYSVPNMMGWTTQEIVDWSKYDSTGQHPETRHRVRMLPF